MVAAEVRGGADLERSTRKPHVAQRKSRPFRYVNSCATTVAYQPTLRQGDNLTASVRVFRCSNNARPTPDLEAGVGDWIEVDRREDSVTVGADHVDESDLPAVLARSHLTRVSSFASLRLCESWESLRETRACSVAFLAKSQTILNGTEAYRASHRRLPLDSGRRPRPSPSIDRTH